MYMDISTTAWWNDKTPVYIIQCPKFQLNSFMNAGMYYLPCLCMCIVTLQACPYFLHFQLSRIQSQADFDLENPTNVRVELSEKIKETNNLKNELERVKKDKNITSGLVTQMQRDMGNKVR